MLAHFFHVHVCFAREPFVYSGNSGIRVMGDHRHFDPVAGGEQGCLTNSRTLDALLQNRSDSILAYGKSLAQFNRRGLVIQSDMANAHGANLTSYNGRVQVSVFM